MERVIHFTKNEKLAMLKILIDISNHYSERLPHASQIIRKKSIALLELSDGVEEASSMPLTKALDIVNEFKHDKGKIDFIKELLAEMLKTSHFGAFYKYENCYCDDSEELMEEFRAEWSYIYQLLREIILVGDEQDLFTIELISWRYVYMHYKSWVVLEECQHGISTHDISPSLTF